MPDVPKIIEWTAILVLIIGIPIIVFCCVRILKRLKITTFMTPGGLVQLPVATLDIKSNPSPKKNKRMETLQKQGIEMDSKRSKEFA